MISCMIFLGAGTKAVFLDFHAYLLSNTSRLGRIGVALGACGALLCGRP